MKWRFSYTNIDGRKGNFKVIAPNKIDAIKKGMDRAKRDGETITRWDCTLIQSA